LIQKTFKINLALFEHDKLGKDNEKKRRDLMKSDQHYFIGINVPVSIAYQAENWAKELTPFPFKQWTYPDDYHITLQFLGFVDNKKEKLINRLKEVASRHSSFSLQTVQYDVFGAYNKPRVLYVSLKPNDKLVNLQRDIQAVWGDLSGLYEKRPYRPHITIAKKWGGEAGLSEEQLKQTSVEEQFQVSSFALFEVHPASKPKYKKILSFSLQSQ
jgi:RNA 2',3'-cyclic 3'-phosphodiesterase